MFKGNNKYYFILLLLFALLVWMEYNQPKPVDWRRTYTQQEKIPFACNAFFRLLNEDVFKGKVEKQSQTVYNTLTSIPEKTTTYIFINEDIYFSNLDSRHLIDFVKAGNNVFMASTDFRGLIADTFGVGTNFSFYPFEDSLKRPSFNFYNPVLKAKKNYVYPKEFDVAEFVDFDTSKVTVLAGEPKYPLFLKASCGKGNFYFFSLPDMYTNYFIVNNAYREVAYKTLSYINADKIWWDEYYKSLHSRKGSPLQVILQNDSLYAAYSLALIALLIFMIFALKRKQKAIPIVIPLQNTTLQFVEIVGSVYYNTKNHKIIAEEKINSFFEFLRNKFSVTSKNLDLESLLRISKLSLIPIEEVKKLIAFIHYVSKQTSITEKELIELNTLIENFYKQNKR